MWRSGTIQVKRGKRAARMTRLRLVLGFTGALAVTLLWSFGRLEEFESRTQDWRQWYFWKRDKPPSQEIAVVAIDDRSRETVGRWPWDREKLAALIDELRRADASVLALDILLSDPQKPREVNLERAANVNQAHVTWDDRASDPPVADAARTGLINDDQLLADSIYTHGRVILASGFTFRARAALEAQGQSAGEAAAAGTNAVAGGERLRVPLSKVLAALAASPALQAMPEDEAVPVLGATVLGSALTGITRGQEFTDLRDQLRAAKTLLTKGVESSTKIPDTAPGAGPRPWVGSIEPNPPIAVLAESAAKLANVTFDSYDPDGLTRRIPLWIEHQGRLWPNLGLAAMLEHRGIALSDITFTDTQTIIKVPGGAVLRLPMLRDRLLRQTIVDGLHYITWPRGRRLDEQLLAPVRQSASPAGKAAAQPDAAPTPGTPAVEPSPESDAESPEEPRGWELQFYDLANGRPNEVSAGYCLEPMRLAEGVRENLNVLATFAGYIAQTGATPAERGLALAKAAGNLARLDGDDEAWPAAWKAVEAAYEPVFTDVYEYLHGDFGIDPSTPDEQRTEEDRTAISLARNFLAGSPHAMAQVRLARDQTAVVRKTLRERLRGRIVFVGWTATGAAADFVNSAIDPRTPGVHVHAAVANALLTENALAPWHKSADFAVLAVMGVLGTLVGITFSAFIGPIVIGTLMVGWFFIAGAWLWMEHSIIAAVAGPCFAAAAAWVVVITHRLFIETRDRRQTEDRFKSYVPPGVVDMLVENPDLADMKPQKRELTVMFSDVADFTTTAERIGPVVLEKTLGLYLSEMTDVLSKHKATIDKFLGDGIMAFWNAPLPDLDHARNCCLASIEQLQRLDELNARNAFEEAGALYVRIGMSTGDCMVGDYGTARKKGYTVLADTANFAARLEGANKFFGSRILAGSTTRDVCKDLRWRFLGKVLVKGKKDEEWLYELIGDLTPKGDQTAAWIEATEAAVDAYIQGRLDKAEDLFAQLETQFDDKKLAGLYKASINLWRRRSDFDSEFDGAIQLTEK
ncbi:MAG: CHASE2 domain-containing protein [Phycisphaerales bacterium]